MGNRRAKCCCGCPFCAPEQLEVEIANLAAKSCADCAAAVATYLVDYVGTRYRTVTGGVPGYPVGARIQICYWEHEHAVPLCGGTHLRVEAWRHLVTPSTIQAEVFPFFSASAPGPSFLFGAMPEAQWCAPESLDSSGYGRWVDPVECPVVMGACD